MTTADKTVYIVDDDPDLRTSLVHVLMSVGLQAQAFGTAEAFLAAFDAGRISCLVLDVRMPTLSGLDVQRLLVERGVDTPFILITGHADVDIVVRAMRA